MVERAYVGGTARILDGVRLPRQASHDPRLESLVAFEPPTRADEAWTPWEAVRFKRLKRKREWGALADPLARLPRPQREGTQTFGVSEGQVKPWGRGFIGSFALQVSSHFIAWPPPSQSSFFSQGVIQQPIA